MFSAFSKTFDLTLQHPITLQGQDDFDLGPVDDFSWAPRLISNPTKRFHLTGRFYIVEFTDLIASSISLIEQGGITALNTQRKHTYIHLGAINNLQ